MNFLHNEYIRGPKSTLHEQSSKANNREIKEIRKNKFRAHLKTQEDDNKNIQQQVYSVDKVEQQQPRMKKFIFQFEKESLEPQRHTFDRSYKRKMLPHLANKVFKTYMKQNETIDAKDHSQKNKMLDLMIDILKQPLQPTETTINKTVNTPLSMKQQTIFKHTRFNTEPSNFKEELEDRIKKKYKGPKVIENQILKHSTNLNVIRKKLFSQHRNRQQEKIRNDLKSSQNNRLQPEKSDTETWNNNVQLLTFYPKSNNTKMYTDPLENEFICIDKVEISQIKYKK